MAVKLKKYPFQITHFVLFLTFATFLSCGRQQYNVATIRGTEIIVTDSKGQSDKIENFIKPYRDHLNTQLSTVLAYAPETIDKSGKWQSGMGNLFADAVMLKANPVFLAREKKSIDIVMLNHGGIRAIIPKGDVTTRTAFEIMPFENSLVVVELKGEQILEMANYIISEKKPHPLSGLQFTIENDKAVDLKVQGQPFDINKIYSVATNDYLYNGGDNMIFFKKGICVHDMDYKLRNILIDYFTDIDTVSAPSDKRIFIK